MNLALPGYTLIQPIYESDTTLVYRALKLPEQISVIIKTLKSEYLSIVDLTRLQHEYQLLRSLNVPGIAEPIALESNQNGLLLVMKDFPGRSLEEWISGNSLELKTFLQIAIQLVEILGELHQQQVIHKDIKPQNILFDPQTRQVNIIDFSISSRLMRETAAVKNPHLLEGTLAYLSPEQTGRMNRSVDYRTDFYSLGVTFYELLTGQLPFSTSDPLELVHCHLARVPLSPQAIKPAIPTTLSNLVMKLLSKMAEDRYQSSQGLKADLETCLEQLTTTGQIADFPVGQLDLCSQFLLPQKLYGREAEVAVLLDAFTRVSQGTTEVVLVSGYSGIGKSSLVNEIHKPIAQQRGYFITGKFDQLKRDTPYAALIQAFQELVRQLLTEPSDRLALWQTQLQTALGQSGQVILEVIPEVEQLIGPQPPVPQLGATETQNRFNRVFQQFVGVFTQPQHPLVLFLDDLQWADSASLKLIEFLLGTTTSAALLLIGAYRDNEVSATHPLLQSLEHLQQMPAIFNQIVLQPLALHHVEQLVSDTLRSQPTLVRSLSTQLFQRTQGNPFFLTQLLKSLHQEGLLCFSFAERRWQWDDAQLQGIPLTENVVELMVSQIRKLPPVTQTVLKLAACIGNKFTLDVLAIVHEKSPAATAQDLWAALPTGLILPLSETYKAPLILDLNSPLPLPETFQVSYQFLHDRVQQAAYSLIPEAQKQATHLKIGQLLLQNTPPEERKEHIFALVNQLNYSTELLTQSAQKYELAELNLLAGQKAKAAAAYESALSYLQVGLGLLAPDCWQTQSELTLAIYESAVETAYLNGDFEQMEDWATVVLQQSRPAIDKMKVYEVKIQACMAQLKPLEALKIGLEALSLLGVNLPQSPTVADIQQVLGQTSANLAGKSTEDLLHLPLATDVEKLIAMRMLISLGSSSYQAAPNLFPLVICEQVNLSIQYGNSPFSAYAYVCYGVILNGIVGDIEAAYQFGELALRLIDRFNAVALKPSVFFVAGACTMHGKVHGRETLPLLWDSYQSGLENGHFEYSSYGAAQRCQHAYLIGQELTKLEPEMAAISHSLAILKQENALGWNQIFQQAVLNLLEVPEELCRLQGAAYQEQTALPLLEAANDRTGLHYFYLSKLILCYLSGNYSQSLSNAVQAERYLDGVKAFFVVPVFYFYDSLTQLAAVASEPSLQPQQALDKVLANQDKLRPWALHAPQNFQHKYELVEAEKARVLGQTLDAMTAYDQAIAGAKEQGYLQEAALGNELAAAFYLAQGRDKVAQVYLAEAYYGYSRWGATAKVRLLERQYPQYLGHLRPQERLRDGVQPTLPRRTTQPESLDLAAVMKAAQALSSEILLERLLCKLMQIVLENAGAAQGALLLEQGGQWYLEASGSVDTDPIVMQSLPLTACPLPLSVINYVTRTQTEVVLNDATQDEMFAADAYIQSHGPKSVLCVPVLHQGKLTGILYLENNLTVGAFTPNRREVLQLLSAQAAIAIENARLYQTLESKVIERTQELQQKNQRLQQEIRERLRAEAAAESANRAKSEFLANMSHELRTPLNSILGYAQILRKSETLTEQQQGGLGVIYRSGEHLLTLINDVLDLSKIEARKVELQLNDFHFPNFLRGIIEICQVRAEQKGIALLYAPSDSLPTIIRGDEKRLRQVLINLLGNAIKFTDRGEVTFRVGYALSEAEGAQPQTKIPTLRFQIEDTGIGISPAQLDEIFLPFHQVGELSRRPEGTGLGLTISRQLVQMMGGEIQVSSQPGQGTTFWVDLKLLDITELSPVNAAPPTAIVNYRGPRRKLLVVDNKWENRAVLVNLLEPLNFEVMEAIDGEDGLRKAHQFHPDLIFMDLVMPVMDGFEAIRRIRSTPELEKIPVIAVSASVLDFNQQSSQAAGCNDFLPKPVRESELLERLQLHLHLEWQYAQAPATDPSGATTPEAKFTTQATLSPLSSGRQPLPPEGIPPAQEINALLDLAMQGDVRGILDRCTQLEQLNPQWEPFAVHLRRLAKGFQEKQILEFIKQYRQ